MAYRALNELLLAVVCFNPEEEPELQAVWDDFLMCKVLPGIDGDSDKLALPSDEVLTEHTLLAELAKRLKEQLHLIWDSPRIELLLAGGPTTKASSTSCRSKAKLQWMIARLNNSGFTSFWP